MQSPMPPPIPHLAPPQVHASELTRANAGVAVLDGGSLIGPGQPGSRARAAQLQAAMGAGGFQLGRGHAELQVRGVTVHQNL